MHGRHPSDRHIYLSMSQKLAKTAKNGLMESCSIILLLFQTFSSGHEHRAVVNDCHGSPGGDDDAIARPSGVPTGRGDDVGVPSSTTTRSPCEPAGAQTRRRPALGHAVNAEGARGCAAAAAGGRQAGGWAGRRRAAPWARPGCERPRAEELLRQRAWPVARVRWARWARQAGR